jgi:tRNA A-37 threonylcarbamoyl transferase component Bud32
MAEFPFQLFIKRIFSKKRAESFTYRGLKKYLRTSKRHIRIKTPDYTAELDIDFYAGAEPRDFIEQIDTLMDAGEVLKKGDAVYVSHITWNNKNIVVKRYDHKGFIHSLRHTIKKSRARKGWLYAHFLGVLNIATPRALAYIEQRRGLLIWQSYLVTEYVEGEKLRHFLRDEDVTERQKLDAIQQVVGLLDMLWKYRVTHGDLKHTNVMITQNGPVLIDLDGMIVHRWELLYRNKRAKDMERFLRKTSISPALNNYCQLLISSRKDSCKKLPDGFEKMRMDNWIIRIRKNFPKHDIRNLVSENDSSAEDWCQFIRVPSSDYTRVFKFNISIDGVAHQLYLKKYLYRSPLDFIKHLFRPSRAKRAFNATLMLHENGFDAPVVIGLFEHCIGPFCTGNLLLTDEIENSKSLPQLLTDICQNSGRDTFVSKRALIEAFGRTIGQMHAKGIFHGDLRLGNVLVAGEERKWRFFFIDNERTKKFYRLPDRLRLKNLVQINMFRFGITNTDRLRFFKTYLRENPAVAKNRQDWAERVLSRTSYRLRSE